MPQLPAFQQSRAWLGNFIVRARVRSDTAYATQREGKWGKREPKVERECPASDRLRAVVCERNPASKLKAVNECEVKARQRARGRKERRKSKPDGKGDEGKLKKGATILNTDTRQMKTYGGEANNPINDYMSEEMSVPSRVFRLARG